MGDNLYIDLRRLLVAAGCSLHRQGKGSHEIWFSSLTKRCFTVPAKVKKTTTANGILMDAGLKKAF